MLLHWNHQNFCSTITTRIYRIFDTEVKINMHFSSDKSYTRSSAPHFHAILFLLCWQNSLQNTAQWASEPASSLVAFQISFLI